MDPSGNLYVADTGNNRVLQLGDGFQIAVGSSLIAPTGVATDPSGSVIIADGSGRLIRVPNESFGTNPIGLNQADQQVLSSPLERTTAAICTSVTTAPPSCISCSARREP
jgi:DNA-binding beta-propeller fold protein YncE